MSNRPLVSVIILTYNHSAFIADAIEGILHQKTGKTFEVFIYDDMSTDGTQEIIRKYEKEYPNLISSFCSQVNMFHESDDYVSYLQKIYKKHTKGEYIAVCEGDDYWCDTNKLQLQIEYMEAHPECSLCAHSSIRRDYYKNEEYPQRPYIGNQVLRDEDVIKQSNGSLPTASLFFRREAFFLKGDFPTTDVGDIVQQLYALSNGYIYYIDKEMCVYRYGHSNSWTDAVTTNAQKLYIHLIGMIRFYNQYNAWSNYKYDNAVKWQVLRYAEMALTEYEKLIKGNISFTIEDGVKNISDQIAKVHDARAGALKMDLSYLKEKNAGALLIYGNGNYATLTKAYLQKNGIRYDGIIVSDGQDIQDSIGVWHISDAPFKLSQATIIVSLHQKWESEVMSILEKHGCKSIIKPFWFDFEENVTS